MLMQIQGTLVPDRNWTLAFFIGDLVYQGLFGRSGLIQAIKQAHT
jgi:hypothetical protein